MGGRQGPPEEVVMHLIIQPAAEGDLAAAVEWYGRQAPGLDDEFVRMFEATLFRIKRHPEAYPVLHRGMRRALLRRFPYGVFYLAESDRVSVLAVMHVRQHPKEWRRR